MNIQDLRTEDGRNAVFCENKEQFEAIYMLLRGNVPNGAWYEKDRYDVIFLYTSGGNGWSDIDYFKDKCKKFGGGLYQASEFLNIKSKKLYLN